MKKALGIFLNLTIIFWSIGLNFLFVNNAYAAPFVLKVRYIDHNTIAIKFSDAMSTSTEEVSNYILSTVYTQDTETITSASLETTGDFAFKLVRIQASGAFISPSPQDTIQLSSNIKDNLGNSITDTAPISISYPPSPIVISEVMIFGVDDSGNTVDTKEFIELYNRENTDIDISNWKIRILKSDANFVDLVSIPTSTIIPQGGFYLIAPSGISFGTTTPNLTYDPSNIGQKGLDIDMTVILYNSQSEVVDMLGYGNAILKEGEPIQNPNPDDSLERKAVPDSTTDDLAQGGAQELWGNGFDSNNNAYDFVLQPSPSPQNASSSPEILVNQAGFEEGLPVFDFMPVFKAISGQDLKIIARTGDKETPPDALTTYLYYSTSSDGTTWDPNNKILGVHLGNNFFKYIVTSDLIPQQGSSNFYYYLKTIDSDNNATCISNFGFDQGCAQESNHQTNAFQITGTAAGTGSILGTVKDASTGSGIQGATVFIFGTGFSTITDSNGNFSLSNLYDGVYNLIAVASGYIDAWIDGISVGTTGLVINLWEGVGGIMTEPPSSSLGDILWTAPFDGMMDAPIDISAETNNVKYPILIAFTKQLDPGTISTSTVKLWKINPQGDPDLIPGSEGALLQNPNLTYKVVYNDGSCGLDGDISDCPFGFDFGPDPMIILYTEQQVKLATSTPYAVQVTWNVKDTTGSTISGNQPGGGFILIFNTTGADFSEQGPGSNYGEGGEFMPPFVTGTNPAPGSFNVSKNVKIIVNFSQPMDGASINWSLGSNESANIKLYKIDTSTGLRLSEISPSSILLDSATKDRAVFTPASNLEVGRYQIVVLGGVRSSSGITMAPPDEISSEVFIAEFDVSDTLDTQAPKVQGTSLDIYADSSGNIINVPLAPVIEIGFSEPIDPSTIDSSTIRVKTGTSIVKANVSYDPAMHSAKLVPINALNINTSYVLEVVGGEEGVKDLSGNALVSNYTLQFQTTSSQDTESPRIEFANADDYSIAITFSEPMNAAKVTDTNRWQTSVLNPANYILYQDQGPPPSQAVIYSGNNCTNGCDTLAEAQGITITYDASYNTTIIKGLSLNTPGGFRLWIKNVTDLSGNTIQDNFDPNQNADNFGGNAVGGPVMNSKDTYGQIGPMSEAGMFSPDVDMGNFGMIGVRVKPINMLAGATSHYIFEIPLTSQLPEGGKIVLTFPTGFDLSNVQVDTDSPLNSDINGPGSNTITLSNTITVNQSARTITLTIQGGATEDPSNISGFLGFADMLEFELKGIKNSTIPKGFDTNGYVINIKTKTPDGSRVIEDMNSMPFFIIETGAYTLSGNIKNSSNTNLQGVKIYIDSPMTGSLEAVTDSNGNYSFNNLPEGDYFLFTEPIVTVSGLNYVGIMSPEPVHISSNTTKNYILENADTGLELIVKIKGNFNKNEDIDIFAGGPNQFRVIQATIQAGDYTTTPWNNDESVKLYLPQVDGEWFVGFGPKMPKNPTAMVKVEPPDYMPPMPVNIKIVNGEFQPDSSINFQVSLGKGILTIQTETSNLQLTGKVLDDEGNPIPDADVYAYSPQEGKGAHSWTKSDGSFTLNLPAGSYKLGAFKPGLPSANEIPVEIKDESGQTKIYINGAEVQSVTINLIKGNFTISGIVSDGQNVIADAPVYAYQLNGPGYAEAVTDSTGSYVLYVSPGTWKVGAFLPGYGPLEEITVNVTNSDITNKNLFLSDFTNFVRISGNVTISGVPQAYIPIRAIEYDPSTNSFTGYGNDSTTDSQGNYQIKVKAGTPNSPRYYRIDIWNPNYGEIAANSGTGVTNIPTPSAPWNVKVETSDVSNVDILYQQQELKTLTLKFVNGSNDMQAFIDIEKIDSSTKKSLDMGKYLEITDLSTTTQVSLPTGVYHILAHIPGFGEFIPQEASTTGYIDLSSDTNATFDLSGISSATVSGTVRDNDGNLITEAYVHLIDADSGMHFGGNVDSNGTYLIKTKAGTYVISVEKPGYISKPQQIEISNGSNTKDLIITKTNLTISGTIYTGTSLAKNAFVWAEKRGGGYASSPVKPDGTYSLYVSSGEWKVFAVADGYQEKAYSSNPVIITTNSVSEIDITLTQTVQLNPPKSAPIIPSSGGVFQDSVSGLKLTIPANSIGTVSASYQIQGRETSNVPQSPSASPLGGKGKEIRVLDSQGRAINTLNDYVSIEMEYTKAEVENTGISSISDINKLKIGYWDDSTSAWISLPTTILTVPIDATFDNLEKVILKAQTNHLSIFAPIKPTDPEAPDTPQGLSISYDSSNNTITLTWTANLEEDMAYYYIYKDTSASGNFPYLASVSHPTTMYQDNNISSGNTYYYKITALDTNLNESQATEYVSVEIPASGAVLLPPSFSKQQTPQQETQDISEQKQESIKEEVSKLAKELKENLSNILKEVPKLISAKVKEVLSLVNKIRDLKAEQKWAGYITKKLIKEEKLSKNNWFSLVNFVTYGTPTTLKLGEGERAGVVASFKSAFGKLPETQQDWEDVIKIANGRWPSQRNTKKESLAIEEFKRIYLRDPVRSNPNDDAAVVVMAYGLRPRTRNLNSERFAIKVFISIYKKLPVSAEDWDIVRAIAYSGAKR